MPTPGSATRAARAVTLSVVLLFVACLFAPWRQSVAGEGRVTAFAPLARRQNVEARVSGRVIEVFVQEGDVVESGDPLVALSDNDPALLERYAAERTALASRLDSYRSRADTLRTRIASVQGAQESAVVSTRARVTGAAQRVRSTNEALVAARAALEVAELQLNRQQDLASDGLASTRELELAELAVARSRTERNSAEAALRAAEAEMASARAALLQAEADALARTQEAEASYESAETDAAGASAALQRLEVTIARAGQQLVRAPRAGMIHRVITRGPGEQVSAGDALLTLVPHGERMAVELWIDGNDVPLVSPGRHVRLQFEGWPAVQFTGWPRVAVGTFGGRVAFVDPTDDGRGDFRVVVIADRGQWPDGRFLRQGSRARGWILLEEVSLGFELWRRLNGFPPSLRQPADLPAGSGKSGYGTGGSGGGGSEGDGADGGGS